MIDGDDRRITLTCVSLLGNDPGLGRRVATAACRVCLGIAAKMAVAADSEADTLGITRAACKSVIAKHSAWAMASRKQKEQLDDCFPCCMLIVIGWYYQ